MPKKCSYEEFAELLSDTLIGYCDEVTDGVKDSIREAAKETLAKIKQDSPQLTGSYKKGWANEVSYEGVYDLRITVHNRTDYQLTHLLEHGHLSRNKKLVGMRIHIKPAEEYAAEKLRRKIEVVMKR